MSTPQSNPPGVERFASLAIDLAGLGTVTLTDPISLHGETAVYRTDHPGVVVKVFDLECGKPDEVSYGPYLSYTVERENFEDINRIDRLRRCLPLFHGAHLDSPGKYAWIAMECLDGQSLDAWCQTGGGEEADPAWTDQLRAAIYETLSIVTLFHEHQIVLIDFKPDNVIRLHDGRIKFVDLGAFFTPRHSRQTDSYVYSATPDYAELVIDTSNVQTGIPLGQSSDIFAAGVALFEMATGRSRLLVADETADQILGIPELYRFRDTQIQDVWHAYPHLKELLPLVKTQLWERHLLFSEVWHLLKGWLAHEVPGWEELPEAERNRMVVETGTTLIREQLPPGVGWLADPIARATTLRSVRLRSVAELMRLLAHPIPETVRDDLRSHCSLAAFAGDLGCDLAFLGELNAWEVRWDEAAGHWAILLPTLAVRMGESASFGFLQLVAEDAEGNRFYRMVPDLEADPFENGALTVSHLVEDRSAWLG